MKNPLANLLSLGVICMLSTSCQTTTQDRKISTARPTSAKQLPAWTKQPGRAQSNQQILITTKLIEISRPTGSTDIPAKKYQRKLSDTQLQSFVREMAQKKGVDVLTTPSVVTRDGQKATVEIVREFVYPTEPGKDARKEVENVGVTSHIDARHLGGKKISIKIFTRVSEFDGFFVDSSEFELPVFKRRDVEASAHLKSGETIVVGGVLDESIQEIEDTGPLGIIKNHTTHKLSRELIIAVTATLVKPDGAPLAEQ